MNAAFDNPKNSPRSLAVLLFLCAGLPLFIFLMLFFGPTSEESFSKISLWAFYLSWVVNWPHFFASYVELYHTQRRKVLTSLPHFFTGFCVPIALIGSFYWCFERSYVEGMSAMIQLMFFIVGWHYFRQTYGIASGLVRLSGSSLNSFDRLITQVFLGSLWLYAYLNIQDGRVLQLEGAEYTLFSVDRQYVEYFGLLSTVVTAVFGLRHFILFYRSCNLPGAFYMVMLTQVVWTLPLFYERRYFYLIPFFHSLQYLAFVYHNKSLSMKSRESGRKHLIKNYGLSFLLGIIGFYFLPKYLDNSIELHLAGQFGKTPFMAAALLFINIHHYFIDSVIWKRKHQLANLGSILDHPAVVGEANLVDSYSIKEPA